jgi:hypothetical protein
VASWPPNWGAPGRTLLRESTCEARPPSPACVTDPDPVTFGLAAMPAPDIRMRCITRSPGGPRVEPLPNGDDAAAAACEPAARRSRFLPRAAGSEPQPSRSHRFEWPARGTEKFLGRDPLRSQPRGPRQRSARPDPVNLFGAAWCERPKPNLPGAQSVSEGQTHLGATTQEKARKSSAWKERTLTFEAINRFGGCTAPKG